MEGAGGGGGGTQEEDDELRYNDDVFMPFIYKSAKLWYTRRNSRNDPWYPLYTQAGL